MIVEVALRNIPVQLELALFLPADWRGLTPLFYQHVNPYGTFRLDMNERMQIDEEEAIA